LRRRWQNESPLRKTQVVAESFEIGDCALKGRWLKPRRTSFSMT
jgi:hypothetical protein